MKNRFVVVSLLVLVLSLLGSALEYGGGGSYIIYQKYDLTKVNEMLTAQGFPTINSDAIGYGGGGYGRVNPNWVLGGEGAAISLKQTQGTKTTNIQINFGGMYVARVFAFNGKAYIRLGGTMGGSEKTLILAEKTNDPLSNREYSIVAENSFLVKPSLDFEYMIAPFCGLHLGISKSFTFAKQGHAMADIKTTMLPDVTFGVIFGF